MNNDKILGIIYEAIDEINEQQPDVPKLEKAPETVLFGKGGLLDSIGLVNLVTDIEERIEDEFNVMVTLADEKAVSQKRSPFQSVDTLADYIIRLVEEKMPDATT